MTLKIVKDDNVLDFQSHKINEINRLNGRIKIRNSLRLAIRDIRQTQHAPEVQEAILGNLTQLLCKLDKIIENDSMYVRSKNRF